jgi:hypothetical protein
LLDVEFVGDDVAQPIHGSALSGWRRNNDLAQRLPRLYGGAIASRAAQLYDAAIPAATLP